jgi:hypothetical protein
LVVLVDKLVVVELVHQCRDEDEEHNDDNASYV